MKIVFIPERIYLWVPASTMTDLLLKLGGIQALLLGAILLHHKNRSYPNTFLGLLVICFGLSCILHAFDQSEIYLIYPHLMRINWGIPLLFGPLLLIYTWALTNPDNINLENDLRHLSPYIINLVLLIPFFISSGEYKIQTMDYFTSLPSAGVDGYFYYYYILQISSGIIGIAYAYDSQKVLNKFRRNLKEEYSSIEKYKADWLTQLLWGFSILSLIYSLTVIFTFGDRYPPYNYLSYYYLFLFIFIYLLSYKALNHPAIFQLRSNKIETKNKKPVQSKRTKQSYTGEQLKTYLLTNQPYLDGELTATKLAEDLKISRHELSAILNDDLGLSFYDLINGYRIEEFKKRVHDPDYAHLTLLAIAYDSGFNSKTTFNTIFKKYEGLTPSQYKKQLSNFN